MIIDTHCHLGKDDYENIEEFFLNNKIDKNAYFATTKTDKPYFEAKFKEGDYIFFGSETAGIPVEILNRYKEQNITIPMTQDGRSLNLAISAGIVLYDALRQNYPRFMEKNI